MKLLANGKICLEIRRLETEGDYLEHQQRQLRAAAIGELKTRMDIEPIREAVRSPYAVLRLRVISEDLRPAYRILYPQDEFRLSQQALSIAGPMGMTCLWLDNGRRTNSRYLLQQRRYDTLDWIELIDHLGEHYNQECLALEKASRRTAAAADQDSEAEASQPIGAIQLLTRERTRAPKLFAVIRPLAPYCMRRAFTGIKGIGGTRESQEPPEMQPQDDVQPVLI